MKILEFSENRYYLKSSRDFFKKKFEKRFNFIKKKSFLFSEISNFLNNCITNTGKRKFKQRACYGIVNKAANCS